MDQKHVFVDWWEVDPGYGVDLKGYNPKDSSPYGVTIKAHRPIVETEAIIRPDNPWEQPRVGAYATVLKVGNTYHAWYEVVATDPACFSLCYATSRDGVHWDKPALGLHEYDGSKENNIVRVNGGHGYYTDEGEVVMYDENAPAEERFKMVFTRVVYDYEPGVRRILTGVETHGAVSADGIHWNELGKFFDGGDTQASLLYDNVRKKYVIMTKSRAPGHVTRRTMTYSESDDFRTFTEPRIVLNGDPNDPPDVDYYQLAAHPWKGADHAFVLFPTPFHRTADHVEVILATSRDLNTIHRPMGLSPIISRENGLPGCVYSCVGMVDDGEGKWIHYYSPMPGGHNAEGMVSEEMRNARYPGICRFIYREDGYTSLHAESHGAITTVLLQFGKRLRINADIQKLGRIELAVADEEGTVLDGFDFADCVLEKADGISYEVKWAKALEELDLDVKYRLRIKLFKSDLYSYTFLDCPDLDFSEIEDKKATYII
ncbi:MAG: hypothetical protein IKJ35_07865 [Clostridia bacterium]|nr:hypothetical protein [Clostridia bacterium]